MSRHRRVRRSPRVPASHFFEPLESRRMLAFTFAGTSGNDLIQMSYNGIGYNFSLNGQLAGSTTDSSVILEGLGGNDDIRVLTLRPSTLGDNVTVRGGMGDDIVHVANGNLILDIKKGRVAVNELAGQGNDRVFVDDDGAVGAHAPLDVRQDSFTATLLGDTATVAFGSDTESKRFNFSSQNDYALVHEVPAGMDLRLGNGNNTVQYGGNNFILNLSSPTGRVEGGTGTDLVLMYDHNGSVDGGRDYTVGPATIMQQTLVGIEQFEMVVSYSGHLHNSIMMLGDAGVTDAIKFTASTRFGAGYFFQLGSSTAPVDLDSLNPELIKVDIDAFGPSDFSIKDQDLNPTGQPITLTTAANAQLISKGSKTVRIVKTGDTFRRLDIYGGSTNDDFAIGEVVPDMNTLIYAGGGDDELYTIPFNGHSGNLDATFHPDPSTVFLFDGESGQDTLTLDDSLAPVGGGFATYGANSGVSKNGEPIVSGDSLELIDLATDAGGNTISFGPVNASADSAESFVIRAGAGSDLITNAGPLSQAIDLLLVAGSGNDTLSINDSANTLARDFSLDLAAFRYYSSGGSTPLGTFILGGTLENFTLDGNSLASTATVAAKGPALSVDIDLAAGDDTFIVGGGDLDSNGLLSATAMTLNGNSGNDTIVFDDHLDVSGGGETEDYTFANLSLAKGSKTLLYSTFENQVLEASDVGPTFNLFSISGFLNSTTINGGPTAGSVVHVGQTNLTNISGVVNLNNLQIVRIHDQNNVGTSSFEINGTQVRKTSTNQIINYSNVGSIELNTGSLGDTLNVRGLAAGTFLTINGNDGNDAFILGNGNIDAEVLGQVSFYGGNGIDVATIVNTSDTSLESQTLSTDLFFQFFTDGQTHSLNSVSSLDVIGGPGGTNFNVVSVKVPTRVVGLSGNDTFTVGGGNIDANFPTGTSAAPSLFVDGGGGADSLVLTDVNDATTTDTYTIQRGSSVDQLDKADSGSHRFINWTGMESATLDASNAPTTFLAPTSILITNPITPLRINGNSGSDSVSIADPTAPVTVQTGLGDFDSLIVNSDSGVSDAPATVVMEQSDDLEQLIVNPGGTLRIATGALVVKTRGQSPTGFLTLSGVLDIAGGAFLSRAGGPISLSQFRDKIIAGRNAGAWNGTSASGAINSSLAAASILKDGVGYGLGSEVAPTTIGPFSIAAADTLVCYTFEGDADLNQIVNLDDFNRLAGNFNQTNRAWTQGDSTYDGLVNLDDFNGLAGNFNQSTSIATALHPRDRNPLNLEDLT